MPAAIACIRIKLERPSQSTITPSGIAISSGSHIDATDDEGNTALARMCRSSSGEMSKTEVQIALWLIANNADVMKPNDSVTPLHPAAQTGSLEVVNALVDERRQGTITKLGSLPLHY